MKNLIAAVLLLVCGSVWAAPVDGEIIVFQGHYYSWVDASVSWDDALNYADGFSTNISGGNAENWHLATITSRGCVDEPTGFDPSPNSGLRSGPKSGREDREQSERPRRGDRVLTRESQIGRTADLERYATRAQRGRGPWMA